jgi:hypothetical protein
MKCVPVIGTTAMQRCKFCNLPMNPDESRECSGSVVTVQAAAQSDDAVCCGGPVVMQAQAKPMVLCVRAPIADCKDHGYERCVKCGHVFTPTDPRERECGNPLSEKSPPSKLNFIATGAKFLQAYAKWRASGKLCLPFEGILRRFRICSKCEEYNDLTGQCNRCHCFINLLHDGQGMNKLEWATEQCPLKPPKWNKQTQGR